MCLYMLWALVTLLGWVILGLLVPNNLFWNCKKTQQNVSGMSEAKIHDIHMSDKSIRTACHTILHDKLVTLIVYIL